MGTELVSSIHSGIDSRPVKRYVNESFASQVWVSTYAAAACFPGITFQSALTLAAVGTQRGVHIDIMDGVCTEGETWAIPEVLTAQYPEHIAVEFHIMTMDAVRDAERVSAQKPGSYIFVGLDVFCENEPKGDLCVAISPTDDVNKIVPFGPQLDCVLVMGYLPGDPNGRLNPVALDNISRLLELRTEHDFSFKIKLDGGVSISEIKNLADLGVDEFVIGRDYFRNAYSYAPRIAAGQIVGGPDVDD